MWCEEWLQSILSCITSFCGKRVLTVLGDATAQELVKRTAAHLVEAANDAHGPAAQEIEVSPIAR